MSRRSRQAHAAPRGAGQGRHRRRAAVALTGEHDAALSPVIDPLTNITVGRPVKLGDDKELRRSPQSFRNTIDAIHPVISAIAAVTRP
jgi:hypothetical protein